MAVQNKENHKTLVDVIVNLTSPQNNHNNQFAVGLQPQKVGGLLAFYGEVREGEGENVLLG